MNQTRATALLVTSALAAAGTADAAQINVNANIAASVTWTANNTYNLQSQIYVLPGATLTIQPGTVIASVPTVNGSGSLAITRGARIIAQGTKDDPIIFTSTADVATWTGGDPRTGDWREAANEWGNLTIMGRALVSNTLDFPLQPPMCDEDNVSIMEGLVAAGPGDPNVLFGGGDDNDDSGTLEYVSIRYAGRVVGVGDELNGLSLGGVGRATDINHIEIMNNVDDGIEIWGGTVNLKHVSVWNIGDDAFDFDQGWRGKAQFGIHVQGYSLNAAQGSGVGDNIFETDGAEKADAQPVTTSTIYNFTLIGQPAPGAGDHGTAWRDGARVQYRNCIFMDLGDNLVQNDATDGEGSLGYGFNGTLTYAQLWTTPYTAHSAVNPCANPALIYTAQSAGSGAIGQGFLAEITDSVFFRNLNGAYNNAEGSDAVGVTIAGGNNAAKGNVVAPYIVATPNANMPIAALTRQFLTGGGGAILRGGLIMAPVISLDPRAANGALASSATAPADGFYDQAGYRGAFDTKENWLCGWTAADAYGFLVPPPCQAADIDGNSDIGFADLTQVLIGWGPCAGCDEDVNGDGTVGFADLTELLIQWGPCCRCTGNVSGNVVP